MSFISRMAGKLKAWLQSNDELPREPPVPGRPGGRVGNTRPSPGTEESRFPDQGPMS